VATYRLRGNMLSPTTLKVEGTLQVDGTGTTISKLIAGSATGVIAELAVGTAGSVVLTVTSASTGDRVFITSCSSGSHMAITGASVENDGFVVVRYHSSGSDGVADLLGASTLSFGYLLVR
jgi:hypothetical protein